MPLDLCASLRLHEENATYNGLLSPERYRANYDAYVFINMAQNLLSLSPCFLVLLPWYVLAPSQRKALLVTPCVKTPPCPKQYGDAKHSIKRYII